jgi:hypothetical protein
MINSGIDHYFPEPAFKGADRVCVGWFEPVDLNKNFEKSVIEDLSGIFLFVSVPVADGHGIPIERAIDYFLALPAVQGTTPDMVL